MNSHRTIILHWKGPYSPEELSDMPDAKCGAYLATGKIKYKQADEIQYCGITEGRFWTRIRNHHKVHEINRNQMFWIAKVAYPQKITRSLLELAESIIIYFWQPTLNERKKINQPKPVTLVNHWFKKDGQPRFRQNSLCKNLDDVLSWDGELWRTGNLVAWED